MDYKIIISIRSKGIHELIEDNMSPEDVVFHVSNGQVGTTLVPFKGEFPPSYKYDARKQVLQMLLKGTLSKNIADADEVFYCSYDNIYNVDYIFNIDNDTKYLTLYIVRDGTIIRRYLDYQIEYDERVDLANI